MRTDVHIVARKGRSPWIRASGGLAVRQTGIDAVHLISTAATPLGGDHVDIVVEVEPQARLTISSVAATIALPSLSEKRSTMAWTVIVGAGSHLVIAPLPTIVAADADLVTTTTVRADPTAYIEIDERVQLGRHAEDGGRWAGRLHVDLGGLPALRHQVVLGDRLESGGGGRRAVVSTFRHPDPRTAVVSATRVAARLVLECGASLTTVVAASLGAAQSELAELDSPASV